MKTFSDFKNVAAAEAKLNELKLQRDAIERELSSKLAGNVPSGGTVVQQKAAAMLAGTQVQAADTAEATLRENLAVVREAIHLQEKIVAEARSAASIEIAKEALPGYAAQVSRLAKALKQLDEAMRDEEAYCYKLIMDGVAFTNVFLPQGFKPSPQMDTAEFRTRITDWFKEAQSNGYKV